MPIFPKVIDQKMTVDYMQATSDCFIVIEFSNSKVRKRN